MNKKERNYKWELLAAHALMAQMVANNAILQAADDLGLDRNAAMVRQANLLNHHVQINNFKAYEVWPPDEVRKKAEAALNKKIEEVKRKYGKL